MDPKRNMSRYNIIELPKIKDKERILKAARKKQRVIYKGVPIDYPLISQKKPCRQEGAGKKYSSHESQGPTSKITVSSKAIIYNGRADRVLPR